jgi:SPX domain protein involved in polyphosphate accumulation
MNNLTFTRKERKYLIIEHSFDEITKDLEKHIPVYSFEGEKPYTNIETTYMDTKDFLLFNEYLNRRNFRFKIRLRRYGHNGKAEGDYLVELKVKHNSISIKRRFFLPEKLYNDFLSGVNLKSEIKAANKGLVGAMKTYKLISKLIASNSFIPVLKTSYERLSFQKKSNKIRITVDWKIVHQKLCGKKKTTTLDAVILESKISGKTPKWHKKMVNKLSLLKQNRFSKFATGINSVYFPNRGKYNFYDDTEDGLSEVPEPISTSFELLQKPLNLTEKIAENTEEVINE